MALTNRHTLYFSLLTVGLLAFFLLDLAMGSVAIPPEQVLKSLFGQTVQKDSWAYLVIHYRLPKAVTALLAGCGLSVSGLMMQTLFRNPLAGPYALGLSSGASLGVAFVVMGAGFVPGILASALLSSYGIMLASCAGSLLVLALVLTVSQRLRDTNAILIVGLMFASFTSAITGVLSYFSTAEQLQKFTFWSLGSLGNLPWTSVATLAVAVGLGLLLALANLKGLDALLLGENYARSMGLELQRTRRSILLATGILAGSITAFAGPIAFVGLAVPHIARLLFRTGRHHILFMGTIVLGGLVMLACDTLCQFPGSDLQLPINAVTSLAGAPVVIWLILRKKDMRL